MKTPIIRLGGAALALTLTASGAALAGTSTGTVTVNASVVQNCTVSSPTLSFGNWDVVTYGSAPLNATATITFTCTKGATGVYVTADTGANGTHATGTTRAMTDGASDYLSYELYTDSAHTVAWNTTNSGGHTFAPTFASLSTATATIYGQIPSGQNVPVGSYTDAVGVTINF